MIPGGLVAVDTLTGGAISGGLSQLGGNIADEISGWFGTSRLDRERRAWVQGFATRAASGDAAALRQLEFAAFEKKLGLQGDARPADGKMSPPTTRGAAADALRRLVSMGAQLSQARYYGLLSLPQPQSLIQQITSPIARGAADELRPVLADTAGAAAAGAFRSALPWVVGALALALGTALVVRSVK